VNLNEVRVSQNARAATTREMQEYKACQENLDQAMSKMMKQTMKIEKKDSTTKWWKGGETGKNRS
jgi:hypothetical protein